MRDHDYELVLGYLLEYLHDLHARFRVERAGRLVGQQNIRVVYQCAGYGDSLHLASGHLIRLFAELIAETDLFERLHRSFAPLCLVHAREGQSKFNVCEHSLMGDEVI